MGISPGSVHYIRESPHHPSWDGTVITGLVADRTTATLVVRAGEAPQRQF